MIGAAVQPLLVQQKQKKESVREGGESHTHTLTDGLHQPFPSVGGGVKSCFRMAWFAFKRAFLRVTSVAACGFDCDVESTPPG